MSKPIDESLRDTITKSDLPGLIQDLGELGIDSLLDDGVLKDVPILGAVIAIGKTFGTVRDFYLTKKLLYFLDGISDLSQTEREKLIFKLEKDGEREEIIGEKIVDLLTRIDSDSKPLLVAKAFKLYVREKISYVDLQRVNYAIERFQLCDLAEFRKFMNGKENDRKTDGRASTANFINSGLGYSASGFGAGGVHPTETAKIFVMVLDS